MELVAVNNDNLTEVVTASTTNSSFIEANTVAVQYVDIKDSHIIPSFSKDNETVISHVDFINCVGMAAANVFNGEAIGDPMIRVSHPITGRIPEAKGKPAKDLLHHEKTLYYERMAFMIEIPTIHDTIKGNVLNLTVGGVKSFHLDNLSGKKSLEHFKVFIGFKNTVCTNLCIWTDGLNEEIAVGSINQLSKIVTELFSDYNASKQLARMARLGEYSLTESQFAHLIGRAKLYQYLSPLERKFIPELKLSDTQISTIAKDYFSENSFARDLNGDIDLWRLYNLCTGANKSSYIDRFLERGNNAFAFADLLANALSSKEDCWYLS